MSEPTELKIIRLDDGRPYAIEIDSIPASDREAFRASLEGRQMPVIEPGKAFAYWVDWVAWKKDTP